MSKHHRNRNWALAPQPLPEDAHVIDNHTTSHPSCPSPNGPWSTKPWKRPRRSTRLQRRRTAEQAQDVGVEGVIDCGCELPNLATAIDMAASIPEPCTPQSPYTQRSRAAHGAPGPDGCPSNTSPGAFVPSTGHGRSAPPRHHLPQPGRRHRRNRHGPVSYRRIRRNCNAGRFPRHVALERNSAHANPTAKGKSSKRCSPTEPLNVPCSTASPATPEMGEIARENGWYLSLSGTSSYKGNDGIRESAKLASA